MLIDSADSPLHRVWLVMLYATRLRRAELVQLRVSDNVPAKSFPAKPNVIPGSA